MPRRLITALASALRRLPFDDVSHVHPGAIGAAPVCRDPRCLARRSGRDTA
jgi:hypothetical protein